jgi:hypothetical protein
MFAARSRAHTRVDVAESVRAGLQKPACFSETLIRDRIGRRSRVSPNAVAALAPESSRCQGLRRRRRLPTDGVSRSGRGGRELCTPKVPDGISMMPSERDFALAQQLTRHRHYCTSCCWRAADVALTHHRPSP